MLYHSSITAARLCRIWTWLPKPISVYIQLFVPSFIISYFQNFVNINSIYLHNQQHLSPQYTGALVIPVFWFSNSPEFGEIKLYLMIENNPAVNCENNTICNSDLFQFFIKHSLLTLRFSLAGGSVLNFSSITQHIYYSFVTYEVTSRNSSFYLFLDFSLSFSRINWTILIIGKLKFPEIPIVDVIARRWTLTNWER